MLFEDLNEYLGWLTGLFFGLALLNFFVKFINKKFINKLGKSQKPLVDLYRKFMGLVVRNHKLLGIIAGLTVVGHFVLTTATNQTSSTGVVSGLIMAAIILLGFYGAYIYKKNKGLWLKLHRWISFLLAILIVFHLLD